MAATSVTLKPSTMLAPVPAVMVSCAGTSPALATPNIITIAWAGTICSDPPMVSISVQPIRYSHAQILESREFVVNLVGKQHVRAMDYCGVKSGRDGDKFAACDLAPVPMPGLTYAQGIAGTPLRLGCQVTQVISLGSHDMFLAKIVSVEADASLFDETNKLCMERAELVAFAHGEYRTVGDALGFFGYSVASPEVLARRMRK